MPPVRDRGGSLLREMCVKCVEIEEGERREVLREREFCFMSCPFVTV